MYLFWVFHFKLTDNASGGHYISGQIRQAGKFRRHHGRGGNDLDILAAGYGIAAGSIEHRTRIIAAGLNNPLDLLLAEPFRHNLRRLTLAVHDNFNPGIYQYYVGNLLAVGGIKLAGGLKAQNHCYVVLA